MLPCPLPQSEQFARTLRELGTEVHQVPVQTGLGEATHCLVQTRSLPFFGTVNLISRGPVSTDALASQRLLQDIDLPGPLIVNVPEGVSGVPGFLRLAKPKSVALLTLQPPDLMRSALHQKWRNALRKAERGQLEVKARPFNPVQDRWLVTAEAEQQRATGYRNWPPAFLQAFARQNPEDAVTITVYRKRRAIAGIVLLCHAPWATYHLGVTTEEGRSTAAHNLALWHGMSLLQGRGYATLDLGLLTGPAGLDRFKLRTGAKLHRLGGTWLRLPKLFRRKQLLPQHPLPIRPEGVIREGEHHVVRQIVARGIPDAD